MRIILKYVEEEVLSVKHEFEVSKDYIENTPKNETSWDNILSGIFVHLILGLQELHREEAKEEVMRALRTMEKTDDCVVITFEDDNILQSVSDLILERMPLERIRA